MHISYDMIHHDFFETPEDHARSGVGLVPLDNPQWVLDPCAGTGIWGKVARERWQDAQIVGADIRLLSHPKDYDWWLRGDFLTIGETRLFDVVIANPPFSLAEEFVRHALRCTVDSGYVVMLLRQSFLASVKRYGFFKWDNPPKVVYQCCDRPFFGWDGGTANYDYNFILWQKGYTGDTKLDWVVSRPKNQHFTYRQLAMFEWEKIS